MQQSARTITGRRDKVRMRTIINHNTPRKMNDDRQNRRGKDEDIQTITFHKSDDWHGSGTDENI
jgi:hypothetical protein